MVERIRPACRGGLNRERTHAVHSIMRHVPYFQAPAHEPRLLSWCRPVLSKIIHARFTSLNPLFDASWIRCLLQLPEFTHRVKALGVRGLFLSDQRASLAHKRRHQTQLRQLGRPAPIARTLEVRPNRRVSVRPERQQTIGFSPPVKGLPESVPKYAQGPESRNPTSTTGSLAQCRRRATDPASAKPSPQNERFLGSRVTGVQEVCRENGNLPPFESSDLARPLPQYHPPAPPSQTAPPETPSISLPGSVFGRA
jgi:hypothetical protein